ncbi:MAG: hypothetical protein KJ052_15395 [Candidatus Hydrogenedentes bacterium]|nr:hypothetical protein [Candidatus Hydrogenedentota bacterium]
MFHPFVFVIKEAREMPSTVTVTGTGDYSDGHVMNMRYPSYYPAVRGVADWSCEFLHGTG